MRILYFILLLCVVYIKVCMCDRESECTEVGFGRSAGSLLHQAFEVAREELLPIWQQEDKTGRPTYKAFSPILKNVTRTGQLLEESSKVLLGLIRKTRVGKRCPEAWLLRGIEKHVVPLINLDKQLADELGLVMSFRCLVGSPYPNVDGTCIHQESPDLGSIGSKFLRLLPASPGHDGFSLRESVSSDKLLPTARTVSELIRAHLVKPSVTSLFTHWGHFIQRDTFGIPESPLIEDVDCCKTPETDDCASINFVEDDRDYNKVKCVHFKRSARAQAILGHRESMSMVSTYLDATPVYGPTNEVAFEKKTGYFGYIKAPEDDDEPFEKKETKTTKDDKEKEKTKKKPKKVPVCDAPNSFDGCFKQDENIDLVPGLTFLLTLEHNRLADALAELNPHFEDSLLYNEARRIMLAEYNSITFGEYLPLLMGENLVKEHHLAPGSDGRAAQFIPQVNPGILVAFAVGAYRNPAMYNEWRSEFGRTDILDSVHYSSIENDLYKDLLLMDVQRARDHAIPGYVHWRRFCDVGRPLDKWEDLQDILPKEAVEKLKTIYLDEMLDVDLLAALLEPPVEGGIVGKTFACIMADQFARLRTGNRLYWEHEEASFTEDQIKFIRSTTAVGLLCRNLPLTSVPENPFLPESDNNPLVKCSSIVPMNMTAWVDTPIKEEEKEKEDDNEKKEEKEEEEEEDKKETSKHSEL